PKGRRVAVVNCAGVRSHSEQQMGRVAQADPPSETAAQARADRLQTEIEFVAQSVTDKRRWRSPARRSKNEELVLDARTLWNELAERHTNGRTEGQIAASARHGSPSCEGGLGRGTRGREERTEGEDERRTRGEHPTCGT